jgi:hypothetical protein
MTSALALAACAVWPAGCGGRKISGAYRWTQVQMQDILHPPQGASRPAAGGVAIRVPGVARGSGGPCTASTAHLDLLRRGRAAEVRVKTGEMGAGERVPVDLLDEIGVFRSKLGKLEESGCLAGGGAAEIASRVAERAPLATRVSFHLRYGSVGQAGYVDLIPPLALRQVTPLLKDGATELRGADSLAGVEVAVYSLTPAGPRGGNRLALSSVEARTGEMVSRPERPSREILALPERARYFRLFFLTRLSRRDHDTLIVGAAQAARLEEAARILEGHEDQYCGALDPSRFDCVAIPKGIAVSPEVRVLANGKEVFIPLGGTVRSALNAAGEPQPERVAGRLKLSRPYRGIVIPVEFDRSGTSILAMVLNGGEELTW